MTQTPPSVAGPGPDVTEGRLARLDSLLDQVERRLKVAGGPEGTATFMPEQLRAAAEAYERLMHARTMLVATEGWPGLDELRADLQAQLEALDARIGAVEEQNRLLRERLDAVGSGR